MKTSQIQIATAIFSSVFCLPLISDGKSKLLKKPNVVIILTDDMGYGEISCYNKKQIKTPNIDRLATEGVRFTDFYVPTPYCAPSRATLLTGRFPLRHGMVQNPAPDAGINDIGLNAGEVTMGELFQGAGYHTKCIGKWHLGHKPEYFPVKHGFDEYYGILYSNDMRPVQIIENMDTVEYPVDQRLLTQKYTSKALDFIQRNQHSPFFLYLAHAMPHKPLAASADFYSKGDHQELYNSVIRELDWSVGEVTNKLKELGILENTILIFMSDNGPWYGGNTGGFKGMKATNWEGGTRVPFIIRYPQQFPQGKTITTPCWSPDILPTIMKLSNIKTDSKIKLDGQNISAIIKGKSGDHPPIFTMKNTTIRTIRDGKWKLFLSKPDFYHEVNLKTWTDERGPDGTTIIAPMAQATPADYPGLKPEKMAGEMLLFDLENDPTECTDLSGKYPQIKEKMIRKYHDFLNSLH
ncbi:MAG: sulfatase-like hydrolase/transferase [Mariniphaga sp.]|nr:sulfatase-like hydrolase/transferase [Mariniphaga sp.]